MEQVWIQSRQHDLLKTFCRMTGKQMEDVLEGILLDWAETAGKNQMKAAIGASPFMRGAGTATGRGPAKILSIRTITPAK